jgi:putative ABC transport system permease protein
MPAGGQLMRVSVFSDAAIQALSAVRADPARASGVIVGVVVASAALTLLSGIAASGRRAIEAATSGTGGGTLEISPMALPAGERLANPRGLEALDARALADHPRIGAQGVASRASDVVPAVFEGREHRARVLGVSPNTPRLTGLSASEGRSIGERDELLAERVAMVGSAVARSLAPDGGLVGRSIRLGGTPFRIVAVLAPAPSFGTGDPWDWDGGIIVPQAAFQASLAGASAGQTSAPLERLFVAQPTSFDSSLAETRRLASSLLRARRPGSDEFQVDSGEEQTQRLTLVLEVVGALLLATAIIALGVSSLNVMNATLISAAERSREIGVRRTLGAARADIFCQFVIEAGVLALAGALGGLGLGGVGILLSSALMSLAVPEWQLSIFWLGPVSAVVAPVVVSAFFAAFPAWHGAGLPPVVALRRN